MHAPPSTHRNNDPNARTRLVKTARRTIAILSGPLLLAAACGSPAHVGNAPETSVTIIDPARAGLYDDVGVRPGPPFADPQPQAQRPAALRPVATVNGEHIPRRQLIDLLIETRGLSYLQQLIVALVAEQEARKLGLKVTARDLDREYQLTLEADPFNGKDKPALTETRKEQLIADWLKSRGVTRPELDLAMHRQAFLRKMAEQRVTITDEMLQREFRIKHGPRAEVRHIQLAAPRAYPQVQQRLSRGEDFQNLVRDLSVNVLTREKGGLMPPLSKDDPTVPPIFAEIAFGLKPGEVSSMFEAEGSYHVVKLERMIPADAETFDQVKSHIETTLKARLVAQEMQLLGEQLLMKSKLEIVDPVLRKQYVERLGRREIIGPPLQP
ncbi:MAG: hypothetical protein DCC65_11165 [Planctomycetota bacterium]|nr:MAG: hypothetical protein DCC65_11165 [Planctomycetota bacterium]